MRQHGKGELKLSSGLIFRGLFDKGKITGNGTLTFKGRHDITGDWKWIDRLKSIGPFKQIGAYLGELNKSGRPHGQGTLIDFNRENSHVGENRFFGVYSG